MLTQIMLWIKSLGLSEEAQGLAEYALILVLIAVVVILALTNLGTEINTAIGEIITGLQTR
jgi:pilus assembly protein Flp/PilA